MSIPCPCSCPSASASASYCRSPQHKSLNYWRIVSDDGVEWNITTGVRTRLTVVVDGECLSRDDVSRGYVAQLLWRQRQLGRRIVRVVGVQWKK